MGGTLFDVLFRMVIGSDSSIYFAGYTASVGWTNGESDILIGKVTSSGSLGWAKHVGTSTPEFGRACALSSDGSSLYVIGDGSLQGAATLNDVILIKM